MVGVAVVVNSSYFFFCSSVRGDEGAGLLIVKGAEEGGVKGVVGAAVVCC